ncbi:MAG: LptF/LptG family permease [Ignavibacteriaceae bacterium]|nr:LptF/LptG family permease [Ignavibacteriaceae bacterium]
MIVPLYILRNLLIPFFFSCFSLISIFILQFLMRFADQLVGKGLDTLVIIQLIGYNLAWMVVLVVPMSVLVATLMAFGGMSQNNEVTILKAAGVSINRMLTGPAIFASLLIIFLIYFNNNILPDANHKTKNLTWEISQQKPVLSIVPNVFMMDITNYAILARDIERDKNLLLNLTIYDYNNPVKINIVTAKKGYLYFTPDKSKLVMDLEEGEIHESNSGESVLYRKLKFTNHRILMNADRFSFQSIDDGHRSERELSAADLHKRVDSMRTNNAGYDTDYDNQIQKYFFGDSLAPDYNPPSIGTEIAYARTINRVKDIRNVVISAAMRSAYVESEINSYLVEIHKKYSIPVACLIFVLLGAPLGVMTRKGGFGMAASISLFFFLIYWAFLIGGEKLADRNIVTPFWGMWTANFVLLSAAVYLLYRSRRESLTLDFSFFKRFVPKSMRGEGEENSENS